MTASNVSKEIKWLAMFITQGNNHSNMKITRAFVFTVWNKLEAKCHSFMAKRKENSLSGET